MSKADRLACGVAVREALCLEPASGLELSTEVEEVSLWPRSQLTTTWRVSVDSFQGSCALGVGVDKHLPSVSPGGSKTVTQRGQPESTEVLCEGQREWEGAGGGGRWQVANEWKEPMVALGMGY